MSQFETTLPQPQLATFAAPGSIPAGGLLGAVGTQQPLLAATPAAVGVPVSFAPAAVTIPVEQIGEGVVPVTVATTAVAAAPPPKKPTNWGDILKYALGVAVVGSLAYRVLFDEWPFADKLRGAREDIRESIHDFRDRRRRRHRQEEAEKSGEYGPGTCGEGTGIRGGGGGESGVREDICAGRSARDERYDSDGDTSSSDSESSSDDEDDQDSYSRIRRHNQRPQDKMTQLLHVGAREQLCDKLPEYASVLSPNKQTGVVLTPSGRLKFLLRRYDNCGFPVRSKGLKGYQELIDMRQDEKAFADDNDDERSSSGRRRGTTGSLRRDRALWALVRFTRDAATGREGPSKIYLVGGPTNQRSRIFHARGRQPLPLGTVMELTRGGPTSTQISENELLPPVLQLNNDGALSLFWDSGRAKGGDTFNVEIYNSIFPEAPAPFEEGRAYACPNPPPDSADYKAPPADAINGGRVYLIEHGTKRWVDPKAFAERAGGEFIPVDCAALQNVPMGPRLHAEKGDL